MKMKTERGRRKVGRRLGLPEVKREDAIRRVSLHPPVETSALPRQAEAPEAAEEPARAQEEETQRAPDDEQS